MKLLPDTNVLVYDTIEDSEHHSEAAEIIDAAEELVIPSIVIYEYMWVMLKVIQVPISFLALKIREYLEEPKATYVIEPVEVLVSALRMLETDKEDVKEVNDYIILAASLYLKSTLATFDHKLRRKAVDMGLKVAP